MGDVPQTNVWWTDDIAHILLSVAAAAGPPARMIPGAYGEGYRDGMVAALRAMAAAIGIQLQAGDMQALELARSRW